MAAFNYIELEAEVLEFVKSNLVAAKDDIAEYLKSKKDDMISFAEGLANGTIPPELVRSAIEDQKTVISGILIAHIAISKQFGIEKAKALALKLAEKVIQMIIIAIL